MKKLYLILAIALIFTTVFPINVFALTPLNIGDKIGDVLNTDVKTYINGQRIPCYNINNKAVVIVADLRNYGFDSVYDDNSRTSTITRNFDKQFTPIQNIANNTAQAGTVAFPYLHTDISAVINGEKVESFNINGNIVIYFESLRAFGTFAWDGATMSSKLTLYTNNTTNVQNTSAKKQAVIAAGYEVSNNMDYYTDPLIPKPKDGFTIDVEELRYGIKVLEFASADEAKVYANFVSNVSEIYIIEQFVVEFSISSWRGESLSEDTLNELLVVLSNGAVVLTPKK